MKIGGLQKVSLIDYPGEICAVIFTIGCNFRCPYCHNPELVNGSAKPISKDAIFAFLEKRRGRLSAVSITGGEPTLHSDLFIFVQKIKTLGFKVKLDTNGTNPDMIKTLIDNKVIDYIAMDIKAPIGKYGKVAGVRCDIEKIIHSISIIKESNMDYEFRTTVVENLISNDDILEIAETIKGSSAYYLQKFIPSKTLDKNFLGASSLSDKKLDEIRVSIEDYFDKLSIR